MADQSDNAPNCVHATPEMITAGRAALLRLVAEDDIRNDGGPLRYRERPATPTAVRNIYFVGQPSPEIPESRMTPSLLTSNSARH